MSKKSSTNVLSKSEKIIPIIFHIVIMLFAISCLVPFLIILGSSFQTQNDITTNGYLLFPKEATLSTYKMVLETPRRLLDAYATTIFITVLGTIVGLWITSTYAYAITRKTYRYKKILSFLIFFTMLFNGGLVPTYILISKWLGLKNSLLALIIPGLCSAWNILLMKGYFSTIPEALIESAKLDGAGEIRIFNRIIMPISTPAFATIALFLILGYWNSWYESLLYIETSSKVTLQYMLMTILNNIELLNSSEAAQYGIINADTVVPTLGARMAMCVLAAGPILVVFPFFQKYFVQGLTVGAVKG